MFAFSDTDYSAASTLTHRRDERAKGPLLLRSITPASTNNEPQTQIQIGNVIVDVDLHFSLLANTELTISFRTRNFRKKMQMGSYKMCMVDMATESVRTWKSLRRKGALPSNEGLLGIILLKKIMRRLVISNGEKHQMFCIWFYRNGNKDDD